MAILLELLIKKVYLCLRKEDYNLKLCITKLSAVSHCLRSSTVNSIRPLWPTGRMSMPAVPVDSNWTLANRRSLHSVLRTRLGLHCLATAHVSVRLIQYYSILLSKMNTSVISLRGSYFGSPGFDLQQPSTFYESLESLNRHHACVFRLWGHTS